MEVNATELFQLIGQKEYINLQLQTENTRMKELNKNLTEQLKQKEMNKETNK